LLRKEIRHKAENFESNDYIKNKLKSKTLKSLKSSKEFEKTFMPHLLRKVFGTSLQKETLRLMEVSTSAQLLKSLKTIYEATLEAFLNINNKYESRTSWEQNSLQGYIQFVCRQRQDNQRQTRRNV
jgi:hypothetical protein